MRNAEMAVRAIIACFLFFLLPSATARAETVAVADCVRDPRLDVWAAADCRVSTAIMEEVFRAAGVTAARVPYREDGTVDPTNAEVICSAFRTPELEAHYRFPLQPLGCMHFGLYATPSHAMSMMATKISEWPRMIVGFSPVSLGPSDDRVNFFTNARLTPKYQSFPTSAGAVEALHAGAIDALFLYTPFGKRPEGVVEVVPIGDRNIYFAVRKDRPELFERLSRAYRTFYIDHIDQIDEWRAALLGIAKPTNRVRVAAYRRGDLFDVTADGSRSGSLKNWLKTICGYTHWTLDYVYGGYDESLEAVRDGRLDIIGGIGFSPTRRKNFLFPHTPIGMLRVFLWTHPGSPYKPGAPSTWNGMRVGLLSATVSGERAKRQFKEDGNDITYREFSTDKEMLAAYFGGEIDACIDVEMHELRNEVALHVYTAHPMYICTAKDRNDLFAELEEAMESICDDFPKYQRMISERHYGKHSEMAALSLDEAEWLARRVTDATPVEIDFSPWPFPIFDDDGRPQGFVAKLLAEFSKRTGLVFVPREQTPPPTAAARFLRGETDFWIPYPANPGEAAGAAVSVFTLPVPQDSAAELGVEDSQLEFEMFAGRHVPEELVSIMRKVGNDIGSARVQELFLAAMAERSVQYRLFGYTADKLKHLLLKIAVGIALFITLFATVMGILLKRQANRANAAAAIAEDHAQAKTRFLAMMSHELRTPLNAVIGFAEFLSREETDERRRAEYTTGILLSSHALLELINDILDLSKLEAGAMEMREGICDMDQLLTELPAIFGYRVRRHGVALKIERAAEAIPHVRLSQQGMRQILINLVGNAAKFTESGSITVRTVWRAETRTLHLEVADTGCGMSDEKMAHLFDPFVQDIASRMKTGDGPNKGTGLGLPIVKRLVEAARGTITAQSTVGVGTTFLIDLPDLELAQRPKSARAAERSLNMARPERVLVVDDMAMNRKILGIHLTNLQVPDIRYAENGAKALEVMAEWRPDLVLTDMWMPEMDGTQLAEAMRRDRALAEIPIVAVTADVDVGSTYDMSLFAKILSKPVTHAKLKALFGVE
ncbi:MAG: transporter substrate-binding domain-containing protein [Kiritimatiellae bacterium]|nr:transporter substrate-binding domain-containing protein [Kiritimatiellia bacterium]